MTGQRPVGEERSSSEPLLGGGPAGTEVEPDAPLVRIRSGWRLGLRSFAANRLALVGVAILLFFVLFCFLGPHLYVTDQVSGSLLETNLPPGGGHPLGTDERGYDELGRLMLGGRAALEIGFLSAVIATVIGTLYGALAGLLGGILDGIMMRIVDVILAVPYLLIVLLVATRFTPSVFSVSLTLGMFFWLVPARLVRGQVRALRGRDFVSAVVVMGGGRGRLMFRHLIPNALGVVVVNATFQVADAILATAALGFLGFGLAFPSVDWGGMLANANTALANSYWWLVYPVGISLILVIMACNFIGNALRDTIDVRLRQR